MKTGFDPACLDVATFARTGAALDGRLPLAGLARLAESTVAPADGETREVTWSAQGLWRPVTGGPAEIRLHLVARATVRMTCQRCLQPFTHDLEIDRTFRFVQGEDEAARLDEEVEEDVLALTRVLDLRSLIEDELILALPIVPRHENCPQPLEFSAEADADFGDALPDRPHPFAALAGLKTKN